MVNATLCTPTEALGVLSRVFGHKAFRGRQQEAVDSIAAGKDTLVLLPTGAGKSACYQVPAVCAHAAGLGTTVVVSPLIALMSDQVEALTGKGVPCAALNSHLDEVEQYQVTARFARGDYALLYVSPERAATPSFHKLYARAKVALLAIDEAHCLSQWGHDFRPEYMRLCELREIARTPIAALTATATPRVLDEIAKRLAMVSPTIVKGDFERENLRFGVEHHRGDATRLASVLAALEDLGFRHKNASPGRAIIYCSTRNKAESVAKHLKQHGFAAGHYHAGRTQLARERAQRAFDLGRTRILVATNAFGMGIDYPDVRLIVHFQAPGSLEAYYQEAGRAGRDGAPSRCVMMFGAADMVTQRRLQSGNSRSSASQQRGDSAILAVEAYAKGFACRQITIAAHFTGRADHLACGKCDVCAEPEATSAMMDAVEASRPAPAASLGPEVQAVIEAAAGGLRRPVGKSSLARALRGSRAKALRRFGLLDLDEHGALSDHEEAAIVATIELMLREGPLERRGQKYPTVWLRGKPVRERNPEAKASPRSDGGGTATGKRRSSSRWVKTNDLTRALENYRRKTARSLKWKPYMVFQQKALVAIDANKPLSLTALQAIPGLGPAKIERFGRDILALVREHADAT